MILQIALILMGVIGSFITGMFVGIYIKEKE